MTTVNATALLVSWDALQDSHLSHYTVYYSALLSKVARSEDRKKVVKRFKKDAPYTNTSDIVNIRELTAGEEHEIHVTASLEIEGKVYEGDKYKSKKTKLGKAKFASRITWFISTMPFLICSQYITATIKDQKPGKARLWLSCG